MSADEKQAYVDGVARKNVVRAVKRLLAESETLAALVRDGRVAVYGAIYDVTTGEIEFLPAAGVTRAGWATPPARRRMGVSEA